MRLFKNSRGAMALTFSQLFLGALTIGIATFRGTESYESFHYETQLGHSNFGASNTAACHARCANMNANNNVVSASIMGPRFSVEADLITMILDAAISCPIAWWSAPDNALCDQFWAGLPRIVAKLVWVRAKQTAVWASLSKLTSTIDKVMALQGAEHVNAAVRAADPAVRIRIEDPAAEGTTWSGDNTSIACADSAKETAPSDMTGAAFPTLMMVNKLPFLPKLLVQAMPSILCGGGGTGGPAGTIKASVNVGGTNITAKIDVKGALGGIDWDGGRSPGEDGNTVKLPFVHAVAKQTKEACDGLELAMRFQVRGGQVFSKDLEKYVKCGGTLTASGAGAGSTCSFDRHNCEEDMLEKFSAAFLASMGLPKVSSKSAASLGGATHAPLGDWNHSDQMRACAISSKPIDPLVIRINDAARTIMTFGMAPPSTTLRAQYEYKACGKWYFPDAEGTYASVAHDQQTFVAGWKYALVGTQR